VHPNPVSCCMGNSYLGRDTNTTTENKHVYYLNPTVDTVMFVAR
jgi:hypothetical protein